MRIKSFTFMAMISYAYYLKYFEFLIEFSPHTMVNMVLGYLMVTGVERSEWWCVEKLIWRWEVFLYTVKLFKPSISAFLIALLKSHL